MIDFMTISIYLGYTALAACAAIVAEMLARVAYNILYYKPKPYTWYATYQVTRNGQKAEITQTPTSIIFKTDRARLEAPSLSLAGNLVGLSLEGSDAELTPYLPSRQFYDALQKAEFKINHRLLVGMSEADKNQRSTETPGV